MKKYVFFYFLCFYSLNFLAQNITTTLIDSISYPKNKFRKFIDVDHLNNYYFTNFEVITKTDGKQKWVYTNYELGIPHSISTINPLQILVFYKEANTIIFLDRFLNETQRIDLNDVNPIKIGWWVENTKNQEIWIYDGAQNILEFYNYKQNNTLSQTIPFLETPTGYTSNFNNAFILFKNKINQYNIQGTLLKSINHEGSSMIKATNSYVISKKNTNLQLYTNNLKSLGIIKNLKNIDSGFSLKNEKLYIYYGSKLYVYKLSLPTKLN